MTGRRLVATAVLTCAMCAPVAAQAGTVQFTGEPTGTVDLATLTTDVDARYTVRTSGAPATHPSIRGHSVEQVMESANVDGPSFKIADVLNADGSTAARLLSGQIFRPDDGDTPPVIWDDSAGTHFLRASSGPGDDNGDGEVTVTDGPLQMNLHGNLLLGAVADASTNTTKPHRSVTFVGTPKQFGDGAALTYTWLFGDKTDLGHGASVRHRFTKRGSYTVLLTIKDAQGNSASGTTTIQVDPAKSHHHRAGGGHNDNAAAPTSGAADGGVAGGAGTAGGTRAGATATAATAAPAAHHAAASAPKSVTKPKPTRPAPAGVPRLAPPTSTTALRAAPTPTRAVHGQLLSVPPGSEVVALRTPAAAPKPRVATRSGNLRPSRHDDGGGFTVPTVVWELALVALLLSAGWWLDRRDSNAFPSLPWTP